MSRLTWAFLVPLFLAIVALLRLGADGEGPMVGLTLLALATSGGLVAYGMRA